MIEYTGYKDIGEVKKYVINTTSYNRVLTMITGLYLLWFGDGLLQMIFSGANVFRNLDLWTLIAYLFVTESLTFNCHEYYNKVMILIPESPLGIISAFLCTIFFTLFLIAEILFPTKWVLLVAGAVFTIFLKNIQVWCELPKENPMKKYFKNWTMCSFHNSNCKDRI